MALSHALLAVISERPSSGYDLAKQFDGSIGFFLASNASANLSRAVQTRKAGINYREKS